MNGQSLGMIETWGYVAAVQALDAGMKAACVCSGGFKVTPSALVTVSFTGDVSAVKTAVSAGAAAAQRVGKVVAQHVIPRSFAQICADPPGPSGRPAAPLLLETAITEADSSNLLWPETKISEAVNGPDADRAMPLDRALKERPGRKSKAALSEKMGKRSDGTPAASHKKTVNRMQKKKLSRAGKEPDASEARAKPADETDRDNFTSTKD